MEWREQNRHPLHQPLLCASETMTDYLGELLGRKAIECETPAFTHLVSWVLGQLEVPQTHPVILVKLTEANAQSTSLSTMKNKAPWVSPVIVL